MKALIILFALASQAMASDIDKRPVPFALGGSQAVFADFTHAEYKIT
jgi:hypothetical protein